MDAWTIGPKPCPECGEVVESRMVEQQGPHAQAMVFRGLQYKRGPQHLRRCIHWRKDEPEDRS